MLYYTLQLVIANYSIYILYIINQTNDTTNIKYTLYNTVLIIYKTSYSISYIQVMLRISNNNIIGI